MSDGSSDGRDDDTDNDDAATFKPGTTKSPTAINVNVDKAIVEAEKAARTDKIKAKSNLELARVQLEIAQMQLEKDKGGENKKAVANAQSNVKKMQKQYCQITIRTSPFFKI